MSAFEDEINDMNNLLFDGLAPPGLTAIRPRPSQETVPKTKSRHTGRKNRRDAVAGQSGSNPTDMSRAGRERWWAAGVTFRPIAIAVAATRAEILAGTRPACFATFFHLLDDGSTLVADGPHPESSPIAVVGGTGRFVGASGELYDEILGRNSTGGVSLRLTIHLKKRAPK